MLALCALVFSPFSWCLRRQFLPLYKTTAEPAVVYGFGSRLRPMLIHQKRACWRRYNIEIGVTMERDASR
jgi:hypothetical protein